MELDPKLRTSIVEGTSVFLALSDQPQVAAVFYPPALGQNEASPGRMDYGLQGKDTAAAQPVPGLHRRLPPLTELIERGRVLALNMPAGANPEVARAIGVLL